MDPRNFAITIIEDKFNVIYEDYKKHMIERFRKSDIFKPLKQGEGQKILQDNTQKEKTFPDKLPDGTDWNNFMFVFLDDENVLVNVWGIKRKINYHNLNLVDTRNKVEGPKPSVPWEFFKTLAKYNGEIEVKDRRYKDSIKHQKKALYEALKSYFKISYPAFWPARQTKSYRTRFKLYWSDAYREFKRESCKSKSKKTKEEEIEELMKEEISSKESFVTVKNTN